MRFHLEAVGLDDVGNEAKNPSHHGRRWIQSWQGHVGRNSKTVYTCRRIQRSVRSITKTLHDGILYSIFFFIFRFHPDPLVLNVYKSRLNHHIETGVGSNLKTRLSSDLQVNIESHEQEMIERMTALLPAERQQFSRNILPRRESFEVLYHLHFDNLCADFQEDIGFKFSLGFSALMKRFMMAGSSNKKAKYDQYTNNVPRSIGSGSPQTPTNEFVLPQDDWSVASKVAIATLTSQGTMGGLLVGGFLLKTVGWRVIAFSVGLYGGIYMYERLTWTNQAKCKEFKKQYVDHAARKLRLVVDMTSANCSHQVQQELSSTFARLCHLVDETTSEMKDNISGIDRKLQRLDDASNQAKLLKNQANFIANKLERFDQSFLTTGNHGDEESN